MKLFIINVVLSIFFLNVSSATEIKIITVLPYNVSTLGSNVVYNGAALDLAAENLKQKYGSSLNITIKHLFTALDRTCEDVSAQTVQRISEYYYNNKIESETCYAIVMSACVDQSGIASLARGFDWLLFNIALSKNDFIKTNTGTPTGIAIGGTFQGYSTVVLEILSYYMWYHATILVEAKTVATIPFYKDIGNLLLESSRKSSQPFALELYLLDTSSNMTVKTAFEFAKQRSRVLILLTTGNTAANILKMADQLAMANGEYVFLNVQAMQSETFGWLSQFTSASNDTNLNAFRSLFFIAYRPAEKEYKGLNSAIAERSKATYNITYKNGNQPLDSYVVESSYNLVELLVKMVSETSQEQTNGKLRPSYNSFRGRDLAKKMSNRSFPLLTGDVYVDGERARNLNIGIFGFNTSTMALQLIGTYQWAERQLVWDRDRSVDWPFTDSRPPPDIPVCGFSEKERACAAKVFFSTVTSTLAFIICCFLLCGVTYLVRWFMAKQKKLAEDWWQLDYQHVSSGLSTSKSSNNNSEVEASVLRSPS